MHGEETGRPCRHEVSGRPARPNLALSIRQVDGVNAVRVQRSGEINRNTRITKPTLIHDYETPLDWQLPARFL